MKLKLLVTLITALLISLVCATTALAAPPAPITREIAQPSGETFSIRLRGDEWLNWNETPDGYVVVQGIDEYWHYAFLSNSEVVPAPARYAVDSRPSGALTGEMLVAAKGSAASEVKRSAVRVAQSQALILPTLNPSQKTLVILVNFSDVSISYGSQWANRFFGSTGKTINNYFSEVSNGKISIVPVQESQGTPNDGIITVTLPYAHPNTAGSSNVSPSVKIVRDALAAADPYIDYSAYDTNGDGTIQPGEMHLVTILAGYEYAYDGGDSSPSVWGHQYTAPITLDNVVVGKVYTQQGEKHGNHQATIGIFCHELAHSMGLPDLYDNDYSSLGVGEFSLMGSGNWGRASASEYYGATPSRLDAWSLTTLGFVEPEIAQNGQNIVSAASNPAGYNVYKIPTSEPDEYFLIENRVFTGYDASLKMTAASGSTGGIAIWHIDESVGATANWFSPNDNEAHKTVDLEEADEELRGKSLLDNFIETNHNSLFKAGSAVAYAFNSESRPDNKMYNGEESGFSLLVLSPAGDNMTFEVIYDAQEEPIEGPGDDEVPAFPYTVIIDDENNVVPLYGKVEPAVVSAEVALSSYFHINPNAPLGARFISPDLTITNTSTMPIYVSVESMKATGSAPKVVADTKYTDAEWSQLNAEETMTNIALGFTGAPANPSFFFDNEENQEAVLLDGRLEHGGTDTLRMQSKFGLSWPQAQNFKYELTFIIGLVG